MEPTPETLLFNSSLSHVNAMSLRCAIQLGIPDIIGRLGGSATFDELAAALPAVPPHKHGALRRLMRLLSCVGVFEAAGEYSQEEELRYSLNRCSSLLTQGGQAPIVILQTEPSGVAALQTMASWFKSDKPEEPSPFYTAHHHGPWEMAKEDQDPEAGRAFGEAMAANARQVTALVVEKCAHVFSGVKTLVDVGGGTGEAALAITTAFPWIEATVLDLPYAVESATIKSDRIKFVGGDMFKDVPKADAVFIKSVIHDWDDERTVEILKKCKEAIPPGTGKVVVVEMVVSNKRKESTTAMLSFDVLMMAVLNAAERSEMEFAELFARAGFSGGHKVTPLTDTWAVIEAYP